MKWVYLPILFALAFFYTKISFTDFFGENKIPVNAGRKPASIDDSEKLKPFRQRVAPEDIYRHIESHSTKVFSSVAPFKGTIVSDVHVENFGFVIDDSKHVHYQILDFGETSRGKLFYDVLAHLMSAKALDKRISWIDYFEAYKRGLKGYAHSNSYYVEKGIADAIATSEKFLESNITPDLPISFSEIRKSNGPLDSAERAPLEAELKKIFPKIQFFEILSNENNETKVYQVLARVRPLDKVQWIVLKENGVTDHDKFFGSQLTPMRKLEKVKADIYGKGLDNSIFFIKVDNKHFTAFYNERFSSRLDLDDIPFEDYHDIILDQAHVLGEIHARSLGELADDYIKAWAKIPAASVDEKTIELKYKFKDLIE